MSDENELAQSFHNGWKAAKADDNPGWTVLDHISKYLHEAQVSKGFWEDFENSWSSVIEQKLLLIIGEVVEAHEELRSNSDPLHTYYREKDGKPEGFLFELADVQIRLADLVAAITDHFGAFVQEKHEFNQTRPHKHGRQF